MKKFLILTILLINIVALSFVPATADFALILNDLEKIQSILPSTIGLKEPSTGFVCFFGKLMLNLPAIFEIIESEDLEKAQNVLDLSIITDDLEWAETNLQQFIQGKIPIQHEGMYYFVSKNMLEDVEAMVQGKLAELELDRTVLVHGRIRTIPILGIILHLLGFNEGIPIEDEFVLDIDHDDILSMRIVSKKVCKSGWELEQLRKKSAPHGLKVLPNADLILIVPASLLRQVPEEFIEEFSMDFDELGSIVQGSTFIALSASQKDSKLAISFDIEQKFIEKLVEQFEERASIQRTNDWIIAVSEEFTLKIPSKGGVAFLLFNVEEQDLTSIEMNVVARFSLSQEEFFIDVSLSRNDCSLIIDAKISSSTLKELLSEILSDLLPVPEELKILQRIISVIDGAYYYENANPPENLEQLQSLIAEELSKDILYSREEQDGTFIVRVGIKTDLVEHFSEDDIYEIIEIAVDEIEIDEVNRIIYFIKSYEKYELPSIPEIVRDLVEGFRMYYRDYGTLPEDLKEVLVWYTWLPSTVRDMVSFSGENEEKRIVLKIKSDERLEKDLIEELSLEKVMYENGIIIVVFKVE
ncbi:hypothetical protein [Pseudothermotoga sp.]|uniref:hypothetical protein n=1 Tax=Pseudothermotoga sp. TaxID=2033661 RepID=UPI0031F6FE54